MDPYQVDSISNLGLFSPPDRCIKQPIMLVIVTVLPLGRQVSPEFEGAELVQSLRAKIEALAAPLIGDAQAPRPPTRRSTSRWTGNCWWTATRCRSTASRRSWSCGWCCGFSADGATAAAHRRRRAAVQHRPRDAQGDRGLAARCDVRAGGAGRGPGGGRRPRSRRGGGRRCRGRAVRQPHRCGRERAART